MRNNHTKYHRIKSTFIELGYFIKANFFAAIYGIIFVVIIFLSNYIHIPYLHRFDSIFISIIGVQIILILSGIETKKDFLIIFIFHILATIMELFKTSNAIASWQYPGVQESIFHIYNVPLFTGFMYSAVGSYIARAQHCLKLRYIKFPHQGYVILLGIAAYINFFSHHFFWDMRYILIGLAIYIFYPTIVEFKVYIKTRYMHFLMTALLTALIIWCAENFSTFYRIWVYPEQILAWKMVSFDKITSWFLLLILSFGVISGLGSIKKE